MKEVTFVFSKSHNFGGLVYAAGDKVITSEDRAARLTKAGAGEIEQDKPKGKKRASDDQE